MFEIASMSSRPSHGDADDTVSAAAATPATPRWAGLVTACALVAAAAGFVTALPVSAATPGKKASAAGDRAYCQQRAREDDTDMTACMKEMAAARGMRGAELTSPDAPTGQANAETRCSVLPTSQRESCLLRERGVNTTTSGSVKAGGVLKETREVVPAAPGRAASTPR